MTTFDIDEDAISTPSENQSIFEPITKMLHINPDVQTEDDLPKGSNNVPKLSLNSLRNFESKNRISDNAVDFKDRSFFTKFISPNPFRIREHSHLMKRSAVMTCPNCLAYIETDVRYRSVCVTHVVAIFLLVVCLCALPYCTTPFRDADHSCPSCRIYLGTSFARGRHIIRPCTRSHSSTYAIYDD